MKTILLTALLCAAASTAPAQDQTKKKGPLSPPARAEVVIAGKKIDVAYSAPSMRGRKIFGGLEPYNKVWRAGANRATQLNTEADLQIGSLTVPKGSYSLYVWLDEKQWQLIVNKQTGQSGTEYDQGQDLGRVPMKMSRPSAPIETFVITLTAAGGNRGTLKMAWENTEASVPFTVK